MKWIKDNIVKATLMLGWYMCITGMNTASRYNDWGTCFFFTILAAIFFAFV